MLPKSIWGHLLGVCELLFCVCLIHYFFFAVSVYINHRPVFGLTPLQVGQAFKVLGDKLKDERYWSVDRNTLLTLLQAKGKDDCC